MKTQTPQKTQNQASKTKKQKGFTLIEIMIVVVIIGILSSVILPKIFDKPQQARETKVKSDVRTLEMAANLYKLEKFNYPSSINELVPNYLQRVPKDPWGNEYSIDSNGTVSSPGKP